MTKTDLLLQKRQGLGGSTMEQKDKQSEATAEVDFHEAAIIDEQGNEIEITEDMVRRAIHELDEEAYPNAD